MHRYFIEMAYNGTKYHGWQVQPNAISVQEVMDDALIKALRQHVHVVGAGRTDTGVHASYFVAHFDIGTPLDDVDRFLFKINRILHDDIVVYSIKEVNTDAHSRFSALSRKYFYYLKIQKGPFCNDLTHRPYHELDFEKMNAAAQLLFEYDDFTSFSKLHTDTKTNLCKIMQAEWVKQDDKMVFIIKADRFLRNMVRAIVGTLMDIGRGKLSIDEFKQIIEAKDRGAAGASAPPQGLFLADIEYPENLFKSQLTKIPPL